MSRFMQTQTKIDTLTGEVLEEKKNVITLGKIENEPDHIKLYTNDLAYFYSLEPLEARLAVGMAGLMNYEGVCGLTSSARARLMSTFGCSAGGLNNALTALQRVGVVKRVGRGEYLLNPRLFGKGRWLEIRERKAGFKVELKYNSDPAAPIREVELAASPEG